MPSCWFVCQRSEFHRLEGRESDGIEYEALVLGAWKNTSRAMVLVERR